MIADAAIFFLLSSLLSVALYWLSDAPTESNWRRAVVIRGVAAAPALLGLLVLIRAITW